MDPLEIPENQITEVPIIVPLKEPNIENKFNRLTEEFKAFGKVIVVVMTAITAPEK